MRPRPTALCARRDFARVVRPPTLVSRRSERQRANSRDPGATRAKSRDYRNRPSDVRAPGSLLRSPRDTRLAPDFVRARQRPRFLVKRTHVANVQRLANRNSCACRCGSARRASGSRRRAGCSFANPCIAGTVTEICNASSSVVPLAIAACTVAVPVRHHRRQFLDVLAGRYVAVRRQNLVHIHGGKLIDQLDPVLDRRRERHVRDAARS